MFSTYNRADDVSSLATKRTTLSALAQFIYVYKTVGVFSSL